MISVAAETALLPLAAHLLPLATAVCMQTEPTAETTVTETAAPEETTETAPKETDTVIETPKEETTEWPVIEHQSRSRHR